MNTTYVWSPHHKHHVWGRRPEHYNTYWGVLTIYKCEKCGDLTILIDKPRAKVRLKDAQTLKK